MSFAMLVVSCKFMAVSEPMESFPLTQVPYSKDALRSIIISQRLLGTREISVFHHTDCGMVTFSTPELRQVVKDAAPGDVAVAESVDQIDFHEFATVEDAVKSDVEWLKNNPLVLKDTVVTGWVYDVYTGKVSVILVSL